MTGETPPRGRPRTFDVEAGLETALRVFAARGFDDVSVAELCDLMGVRAPSLYAAYGSKRALFDRAVARYAAETGAVFARAIDGAGNLADLRRRVLDAAVTLYARDGGMGCLVMGTMGSTGDAALRAALADMVEQRRRSMVARAVALEVPEAEAEVQAIVVAMMGLSAAARAGLDARGLRDAAMRLA